MIKNCRIFNNIPLTTLAGVGPIIASKLGLLGIKTLKDLLLHLPLRYENRTTLYPINKVKPGMNVTVKGEILNIKITFNRKCNILNCYLRDDSGIMKIRFFHFNASIRNIILPGQWITAYGVIRSFNKEKEIINPECSLIKEHHKVILNETLTPIYQTVTGIRQITLRKIVNQALKILDITPITELLPPELRNGLISLPNALKILHYPPSDISLNDLKLRRHPAQRRIILEELLAYNLCIKSVKIGTKKNCALPLHANSNLLHQFISMLPFTLTRAQIRVTNEIIKDLSRDIPMMRLIQGDVGSGKTLVAALAALCAISDKHQVALMAPTELLAEQHAYNFQNWFSPLGIKVGWLSGRQKGKARHDQQKYISNGQVAMIIGTHAIFQKSVQFSSLALVIIDEQHRFGVHQRFSFWKKGITDKFNPHQLIMTATPIPRTLAMTCYADLNISIIDELPQGRTSVTTVAIPDYKRDEVIQRVLHVCINEQRQAYWICTLIDKSNLLEIQSAKVTWQKLKKLMPQLRIGLVHGRMNYIEKQKIMKAFKSGIIQLLVATTVIEVGIDVSNASIMIIENSERLGLTQLHQLRGRIGRSTISSYCILLYKSPLSKVTRSRLHILRKNQNGFIIAQKDLEIRGPGDILGTRQTGSTEFKVADLMHDGEILNEVKYLAKYMYQNYPDMAYALINRWIPDRVRYVSC